MAKKLLLGCGIPLIIIGILLTVVGRSLLKAKPSTERSEIVSRGDVEIKVIETGTIEPLRKVEVKSKAGGRVTQLFVDDGAEVKQGQILATIESEEVTSQVNALRAQLAGAQARLAAARKGITLQQDQTSSGIQQFENALRSAEARLHSAETESQTQPELTKKTIEIAQANLEAAQANLKVQQDSLTLMLENTHPQNIVNAQSAYDRAQAQVENVTRNVTRQKQLLAKGFVAQQALDNAETDLLVADAQKREAKQRLDRIKQTNELEAANARSQIASAKSQVRQNEATLAQAKMSTLPITREREMENLRAAYEQSKAQLLQSKSNRIQDRVRVDEALSAEATVRQLQNQLKEVLVRQQDTTLYAAMAGVVTKRYVEKGEVITSATSSFSSGTPVFQISDLATMLVKINVNEVDIAKLKLGLPVEVTMDSAKGTIFAGRVRKVAPAALNASSSSGSGGSSSGNTSSTQTVIRFPLEVQIDKADTRLKPGMSARCTIIVARKKDALRVPVNCIQGEGDNTTVQVVTTTKKDRQDVETTAPRKVKIGLRGDDFVEIVEGVQAGEKLRPNAYKGPERKTIEVNGGPGG